MSKFSRTTKGLFTLAVMAMLFAACSSPKYYVFKTIKHTPVDKNAIVQEQTIAENEHPQEQLTVEVQEETVAVASTEKVAEEVNLSKIRHTIAEKASPKKTEKISKIEQIKTAIQVKKELKKFEKQQEAAQDQDPIAEGKGKSQLVALLLVILVGVLGIHRFYLGYTTIGIIQLLTLGGCGVWALIDLIRIAMGDLKPIDGDYEETL